MNSKSLFNVVLVAAIGFARQWACAQVPSNFTAVTTTIFNSNLVAPGYVFLASGGRPGDKGPFFLQVMNNNGTPHKFKAAGYNSPGDDYYAYDFKVLPDGRLLQAQSTSWFNYTEGSTVVDLILDENLNLVESIQMGNGYQSVGHDFELLPNGHLLMIGYYTSLADLRSVRPTAYPRAEVSGAVIQELDGNRNVIWQWRSWDHFNWIDFADWGPKSTDRLVAGWHVNAARLDPVDGQLLVATTGEQMKINRQTGDVLWRLGGAHNQFTFAGVTPQEALRQLAGHDFHRLPNGNFLIFNNGAADGSRSSQVHEYSLDEVNKVATHVWQYIPSPPIATWTGGNAQRLPNGNTFLGWGTSADGQNPDCSEVTSSGQKVFELTFTNALIDSYRAFRFLYPPGAQKVQAEHLGLSEGNSYSFNEVGVTVQVGSILADAYNSAIVAREPYAPLNPLFQGKAPRLLPLRITFSPSFIQSIAGAISFDPVSFSIADPTNTIVYYRGTEGQGVFVPLNTQYNYVTGQLVAELSETGFGEYTFGWSDVPEIAFPPLLVEPESLQPGPFVTRVPPLVHPGTTYTVNEQLPIALAWCPKGFAAGYALQISTNQEFSTVVLDQPYVAEARFTFSNALPDTTYYWRVNTFNDGGVSEWATNAFSTVAPGVRILAPNGGETWRRGLPYFVQWDDNLLENVAISLYKNGSFVRTLSASVPSTVSYQWQPALDLVPASDYSIRITSVSNAGVFDVSDLPFSIIDAPVANPGSLKRLPDGRIQFNVAAPGALSVRVEGSTNLVTWQTIQIVPLINGTGVFTDDAAATLALRYYRLVVP